MTKQTVQWPGWEVVRPIGSGSFGVVYEIRREFFGREERAALKVISIPKEADEIDELYREGYDQDSITSHIRSYLEDIVREYQLMMDMKGHTNIVCCDELRHIQHDDGIGWDIYIKMELLTPLNKILDRRYQEQMVIKLGMDLCNALILCRQSNILHRDIKPANIFVSRTGDFKLGDFGIAKTVERTTGGTKIGTYEYMAPEVYNNQPYGPSADLYALGLVLYCLMNNYRTPFLPGPERIPTAEEKENARRRRFQGEPLPPPANGSPQLKQIVLRACAFQPEYRFADPYQLRQALSGLCRPGWNWQYGTPVGPVSAPPVFDPNRGEIPQRDILLTSNPNPDLRPSEEDVSRIFRQNSGSLWKPAGDL